MSSQTKIIVDLMVEKVEMVEAFAEKSNIQDTNILPVAKKRNHDQLEPEDSLVSF